MSSQLLAAGDAVPEPSASAPEVDLEELKRSIPVLHQGPRASLEVPNTKARWAEWVAWRQLRRPPRLPWHQYVAMPDALRRRYDLWRRACHGQMGPYNHDQFHRVIEDALELLEFNAYRVDPCRPAAIDGPSNGGKTTCLRVIGKRWELMRQEDPPLPGPDLWLPVVYIIITGRSNSDAAERMLYDELAHFVGIIPLKRERNKDLKARVVEALIRNGVELVLIDELQRMLPSTTPGKKLIDEIKDLNNLLQGAMTIAAGVKLAERNLFSEGLSTGSVDAAQAGRRFMHLPIDFLAYDGGPKLAAELERHRDEVARGRTSPEEPEPYSDWESLMDSIVDDLHVAQPVNLTAAYEWLHERSGGIPGHVADLLALYANRLIKREQALPDRPPTVSLAELEAIKMPFDSQKAYDDRKRGGRTKRPY